MSEKVKVSHRQNIALDEMKNQNNDDWFINNHQSACGYDENWSSLEKLSVAELSRALYIGYEVEEEYKIGDWVFVDWNLSDGEVYEVIDIEKGCVRIDWKGNQWPSMDIVRHATEEEITQEKERRFWNSLGRDVWELKLGDILSRSHEDFAESITVKEIKDDINHIVFFEETFSKHIHTVRNKFKLACPVEQRLDQ